MFENTKDKIKWILFAESEKKAFLCEKDKGKRPILTSCPKV